MTFKQFEKIASIYRPDVIVSQHGDYCTNDSKNTLGIVYIKKDGTRSRVYDYSGSYLTVLNKIGINAIDKDYLYRYLFNAVFDNENAVKKALNEFTEKFPTPDYKIEVSRRSNCWEIL